MKLASCFSKSLYSIVRNPGLAHPTHLTTRASKIVKIPNSIHLKYSYEKPSFTTKTNNAHMQNEQ